MSEEALLLGLDVGSTTVKVVVMDEAEQTLSRDYRRHNARQLELAREFLAAVGERFPGRRVHLFTTGSGGRALAARCGGATYIQEVNALSYAVERRHPRARSVVELGGQDSKVILRREDAQGRSSTLTFMNDKCAGGTGATIDRIFGKLGLSTEVAAALSAEGRTIHPISAKCGVFSETDVIGLLKTGIAPEDIFVSLCAAIARQNLEVLVRGHVLMDEVLLLGGPHSFFGAFEELWRALIPEVWRAHRWSPSEERPIEELVYVPDSAQYFAALGAALYGWESLRLSGSDAAQPTRSIPEILRALDEVLEGDREARRRGSSSQGQRALVGSAEEAARWIERCRRQPGSSSPRRQPAPGERVRAFVGLDGGSTSTKLVVLDEAGDEPLHKDYVLSMGNPIVDARAMFGRLRRWRDESGIDLEVAGVGVTGYAARILQAAFDLDVTLVETVAHLKAAEAYYGEVDVVCDVGGQDIKVLFSKHGRVVHFKVNTQCSAGNGYFLQAMADQLGLSVEQYGEEALGARQAPVFNCGCAVFMEQDKVNFQQLGWSEQEIMAGLALVLPQNIWHYVVQDTNIARHGRRIVLQGGTQRNLAAVKAQIDYIEDKVDDVEVFVHRHADLCGAIGAALEARERAQAGRPSRFVGLEQAAGVSFQARTDEATRCRFCTNRCPRTFVDIRTGDDRQVRSISGHRCEKGASLDGDEMRERQRERRRQRERTPNLVQLAAEEVFRDYPVTPPPAEGARLPREVVDLLPLEGRRLLRPRRFQRSGAAAWRRRSAMVVGIPKVLNLWFHAPFFNAYLRALGVGRIVTSEDTSERLWQRGNKWGAIDPCFPAKVAPAHVVDLLDKGEVTHVLFPIITELQSTVERTLADAACVIQMGTAEVVEAALTRHYDHFAARGVGYWKPLVRLNRPRQTAGGLYEYFRDRLEITEEENAWATRQGFLAMETYLERMREAGRRTINDLVDQDRLGLVILGHPYHHDPGLNHGIPEQFQLLGYPLLCIESLPTDPGFLGPLFAPARGKVDRREWFDIRDVWQRNFNRNTNHKLWAAKVAARHPNLAVIDLSSFKCGHDAPTYSYLDAILDASETPHFLFHDIDQNRPSATHRIRIETIDYFLRREEAAIGRRARETG